MAECGLLNFVTCLPEKFFEYVANIISSPLQPLLDLVNDLLSAQVNLSLFTSFWAIMVYILSMFYALLILYSGFSFIISGYDVHKRENAKEWLKNIVIMIILVQASFFIYELAVEISSSMTSTTLTLVNSNFFDLSISNISDIATQILFFSFYTITLLVTALILIIRYGIVAIGVVLFPLSIFLYFLLPLRAYGLLILNFLGISMFITFIDAVLLVGFSKLIEISIFANIKVLVMIGAFGLISIVMFFLMFFSVIKSAFNVGTKAVAIASTFI